MHSLGEGVSCQGTALLILRIQKKMYQEIHKERENFRQGNICNIPLQKYIIFCIKGCAPLLLRKFVNISF